MPVFFHNARFIRPPREANRGMPTHRFHTDRGSLRDRSEQGKAGYRAQVTGGIAGGEAGISLRPGGHGGSKCPVEQKSSRALK